MDGPEFDTWRDEGAALTTARWGQGPAEIVVLHDGLGSIAQWRAIPSALAEATGRTVLAYDRSGHGASTPTPAGPWPADWLHREATVLSRLLDEIAVERPLLVGHSDGASIALIHAASQPPIAGVVSFAAHSWVEPTCREWIARMRADAEPIVNGLARHHDAPEALFEAWSGVWVSDEFATWNIGPSLDAIEAPVIAVQGADDEYVEQQHVLDIADAIGPNAEARLLPGLHHLLHHEDPDQLVELVTDFSRSAAWA